uniref:Uncharacterized protein n=1 Tax=Arundo donax TaxID=35708 RepID=A0A0A8YD84_ARUDO
MVALSSWLSWALKWMRMRVSSGRAFTHQRVVHGVRRSPFNSICTSRRGLVSLPEMHSTLPWIKAKAFSSTT